MTSFKKAVTALVFGVLVVTSTPIASANSYSYAYSYDNSAKIAELYATIQRLQAELARLQNSGYYSGNTTTSGDVRVLSRGSVELRGVAPSTSGTVRAWFEYGPTMAMQYSTPVSTVSGGRTFYGIADDIDSNRTYYYRAVSENRNGYYTEGITRTFRVSGSWGNSNDWDDDWDNDDWWDDRDDDSDDEDRPRVTTDDADDVTSSRAELSGEVDMQDAENGLVFFVYGEDEDMVEDVEDEDRYNDIDTDGDDLQKVRVDSSFDGDADFYAIVSGLDDDTEHFFRLCVEYEDDWSVVR
ncbi:MAG: hypothetical protein MUF19_01365 [Candidatus Pacebacteria bacterium]|nr:hypothetical protein [Candidatus Paceibacterota bacterium]